eukprot:NODE_430_length_1499_cov_19.803448_g318_i0.p1 GENE.NODE_430_length_1499_cov_19.803448_g318_i0~~NODE_430_length_1499_cov_19.803448_g318_i0.p1  ORF type:complete len:304 (+),score=24.75 NODE_430_length_1499_cov_19.803448_g318_i0:472-1383(+)
MPCGAEIGSTTVPQVQAVPQFTDIQRQVADARPEIGAVSGYADDAGNLIGIGVSKTLELLNFWSSFTVISSGTIAAVAIIYLVLLIQSQACPTCCQLSKSETSVGILVTGVLVFIAWQVVGAYLGTALIGSDFCKSPNDALRLLATSEGVTEPALDIAFAYLTACNHSVDPSAASTSPFGDALANRSASLMENHAEELQLISNYCPPGAAAIVSNLTADLALGGMLIHEVRNLTSLGQLQPLYTSAVCQGLCGQAVPAAAAMAIVLAVSASALGFTLCSSLAVCHVRRRRSRTGDGGSSYTPL